LGEKKTEYKTKDKIARILGILIMFGSFDIGLYPNPNPDPLMLFLGILGLIGGALLTQKGYKLYHDLFEKFRQP